MNGRLDREDALDQNAASASVEKKSAFSIIVRLCSVRDRSVRELEERLLREGYSQKESNAALKRALECGLVDDLRFADCFIRTKAAAGKGRAWIQRELSFKHSIDVESISGWPEEYGLADESQLDSAIRFLQTHPPHAKDLYSSAYRKLAQRGYSNQVAREAAKTWMRDAGLWG